MSILKITSLRNKFSIKQLTKYSTAVTEKPTVPDPVKTTILQRWKIYWKSLVNDYTEAGKGAFQTAKEKPLRTSILTTIGLAIYFSAKNNPDELSLMTEIKNKNGEILMVHESCQRASSAEHLRMLEQSMNQKTLRVTNLGVMTIVWLHDFSSDLCTYKAICKWLQPEYTTFHQRIIDVGFWNKWWNLESKMTDYDIVETQS
ncbi:mitochondrial import inner membrane translocase subunit Tim29 [Episyrphus balteatus]|uniref:mitochondrial import inner membrane translocase subunit Tim29 n=1 Tax=Episyrphus balteatus TaxID=286459 RepID=UPI00248552A9|nr:mitochondrial import inner membrane translocase subunit Tim29 [Episyrphus balteatus]